MTAISIQSERHHHTGAILIIDCVRVFGSVTLSRANKRRLVALVGSIETIRTAGCGLVAFPASGSRFEMPSSNSGEHNAAEQAFLAAYAGYFDNKEQSEKDSSIPFSSKLHIAIQKPEIGDRCFFVREQVTHNSSQSSSNPAIAPCSIFCNQRGSHLIALLLPILCTR